MTDKIMAALKAIQEGDTDYAIALLEDAQKVSEGSVLWLLGQAMLAAKQEDKESLVSHLEAAIEVAKKKKNNKKEDEEDDDEDKDEDEDEDKKGKGKGKKKKEPFGGKQAKPFEAVTPVFIITDSTTATATSAEVSVEVAQEAEHTEDCNGDCPYDHAEAVTEGVGDLIIEAAAGHIEEALDGPNVYRATLIKAGMSRNRNFWSPNLLQTNARMFENAKAFADHPTKSEMVERPERSIKDIIGFYDNVRWQPTVEGGSLKGDFHVLDGPVANIIQQAHAQGRPDLVQLSVNISGRRQPRSIGGMMAREITELHRVHSVDAVTEASAGGSIDRVAASENTSKEVEELMELDNISPEDLLAAIEGRDDLKEAVTAKFAPSSEGSEETTEEDTQITESAPSQETEEETSEVQETETEEETTTEEPSEVQKLTEAVEELQTQRLTERAATELDRKLSESKLPKPVQKKVRKRYAGRIFEADTLDSDIEDERQALADLAVGQPPQNVPWAQAGSGDSQRDRFAKAMDGLLAGEAVDGVKPFLNLRHAYFEMTGKNPFEQTGHEVLEAARGYDSGYGNENVGRVTEATATPMVRGDFTAILGDSITRRALAEYKFPALQEWRRVALAEPVSDLREQKRERLGEFYLLKKEADVASGEIGATGGAGTFSAYADLTGQPLPESEAIYQPTKAHGQASLSLETIINDDLGKFRNIPRMLGRSAAATIYVTVFDFLADNPAESTYLTSGSTPRLFDSNSNRAPGNLVTDTASTNASVVALNNANMNDAKLRFSVQQAPVSSSQPYTNARSHSYLVGEPSLLIVAPQNLAAAKRLMLSDVHTVSRQITATTSALLEPDVNIHKGSLEILQVKYWQQDTDTTITNTLSPKNMWFVTANPTEIPMITVGFLAGREDPEIFAQDQSTPAAGDYFLTDKITYKVRHYWGANPVDHRGMVGATVIA